MRKILLQLAFVTTSVLCASLANAAEAATSSHTARDMWHQYMDTHGDCGSNTAPVFLCTGILIRETVPGPGYYSWQPSPEDVATGRISFSYLRKDAKFGGFKSGGTNGLTLFPALGPYKGPSGQDKVEVLCAFPMDGWTDHRPTDHGCGPTQTFPSQSVLCQQQGIFTAQAWLNHWNAAPGGSNRNLYQCGFDVRHSSPYKDTTDAFNQVIKAMQLLGETEFHDHNELVISAWSATIDPSKLPIQSFFYVAVGNDAGGQALANAQKDQKDYYNVTRGGFIPIVRITPPASLSDDYDFHFKPEDQAVPIP
ncbi:hypothetical protein [Pandoraea pulmonicola]|uniref:Halovibrin n=1 Tax=Pandoraea pulmonicola TaxID=93221 RepID=A0AAJ4ZHN1_PANPU|nr:hypothetical protein [Pandoraea pulmonicola]AJC22353.1 hypothetical protein RO07_21050 [Pandoraea pulmonicola]SUD95587.1 Uncharacterised protein [Pandoraea pulmonicola]